MNDKLFFQQWAEEPPRWNIHGPLAKQRKEIERRYQAGQNQKQRPVSSRRLKELSAAMKRSVYGGASTPQKKNKALA